MSDQAVSAPPERQSSGQWLAGLWGRIRWNDVWVTLASFILALVVGAILMVVSDTAVRATWAYFFAKPSAALSASWDKVWSAYSALFQGAIGSWTAFTFSTAQAAPLICAGLGVGLSFRAGLFNIGAQGQAIWGSILAAWVGFNFAGLPLIVHLPFAILAGLIGGSIWGAIAGYLKARFGAHEVIVTIMLNYVAACGLVPTARILKPRVVRSMSHHTPTAATRARMKPRCNWEPCRRGNVALHCTTGEIGSVRPGRMKALVVSSQASRPAAT